MNPQVTFETEYFAPEPGEDEHANPGRFGRSLALWMQSQLGARGVSTSEVLAEDFGWIVVIARKPHLLWLACGNTDGSTSEWSICPVAEASLKQRLFGRSQLQGAVDALWSHVKVIVPSIPQVTNITWE
jgi:hypothetical protein